MTVDVACPDDCVLDIDAELMRIALTNYLNNAAKYGNEGTVARLMGRVEGPEFIITVRNEGEGFTATEREALFKRFSRLKNTNTSSKRGSGLGLFLTKQIAEAHGGRVWAEAEPGRWAMFGLALPRSATTGFMTCVFSGRPGSGRIPCRVRNIPQAREVSPTFTPRNAISGGDISGRWRGTDRAWGWVASTGQSRRQRAGGVPGGGEADSGGMEASLFAAR
jgi:hypothetical protein